jgi:hypothetical protein
MTYLAYTKGSGVNEPVRKQYETRGTGKLLTDLANGKKVDPNDTYKYGLRPKTLPTWLDPNADRNGYIGVEPGNETVDPRGYTPAEL